MTKQDVLSALYVLSPSGPKVILAYLDAKIAPKSSYESDEGYGNRRQTELATAAAYLAEMGTKGELDVRQIGGIITGQSTLVYALRGCF